MIKLKKVFICIISVLLIATVMFVAVYDSAIDNCVLEIAGTKYEKDDFAKYYKLVEFEEGENAELDVSDIYEQYTTIKVYLQLAQQHNVTLTEEETKSIEEKYASESVDKTKLAATGITKEEYVKYYGEVMLASKFMQDAGKYYPMPETDYEVYKTQYSDGFKMYSYRILQVTPTPTEGDGEEKTLSEADKQLAKTKVEEALNKAKSGEDFEKIAEEYGSYRLVATLDGYTLSNGQLEKMPLLYLSESVTNTQLYNELVELSAGEYTSIVEDGDSYLFAKLENIEEGLDEASEARLKSDINTMYAQNYIGGNTQIIRYLSRAKSAAKTTNSKVTNDINNNNTGTKNDIPNENGSEVENNSENEVTGNENLVTE